jgi:hypothetical protein
MLDKIPAKWNSHFMKLVVKTNQDNKKLDYD